MAKPIKEVEEGKIVAVLSYLFIGIIWFFVDEKMRKNQFAKLHVQQALVLLIFTIAVIVFNGLLTFCLKIASLIIPGFKVLIFLTTLIGIIPGILWICGLVYSLQGKKKELPVIGRYGNLFRF